jgi:hypothetical protein
MAFGATHIPQRVDEYGRIYAREELWRLPGRELLRLAKDRFVEYV